MTTVAPLRFPAIAAMTCALTLAGCAGGSGGAGAEPTPRVGEVDKVARSALISEFEPFGLRGRPIERHAMRTSGTATFNGLAALGPRGEYRPYDIRGQEPFDPQLVADMAMTVDFSTQRVTGSMWDFYNSDGERAGGSLQLAGRQDGADLRANGSGTLDWGDHLQDLNVSLSGAYMVVNEMGITGGLVATSDIGSERTLLEGQVSLTNDGYSTP